MDYYQLRISGAIMYEGPTQCSSIGGDEQAFEQRYVCVFPDKD